MLNARLYGVVILPMAVYGAETWTLRSQETQSHKGFEMRRLRLLEVLPGQTGYTISRSETTPSKLNPSHIPSDTEDSSGLGTLSLGIQTLFQTAEQVD